MKKLLNLYHFIFFVHVLKINLKAIIGVFFNIYDIITIEIF